MNISTFYFQDNNMSDQQKSNADHHANQMNPNSGTYHGRMDRYANQNILN
jgi:hypothetical protein